jgi:arylsulfatase A-like enzyme
VDVRIGIDLRNLIHSIIAVVVLASTVLQAADRPNILFLLADDQRPDTIRELGNSRIQTPNLDQLVRTGTTLTRATCSYPICVVSRAEILTGQHGWQNGIDGLGERRFNDGVTFWAQTLKDAGYSTWYVGKWHSPGRPDKAGYEVTNGLFGSGGGALWRAGQTDWKGSPITGYRGWLFQSMDGRTKHPEHGIGLTRNISSHFADSAIEMLQQETDKPWFLHVNFTAPHDPLIMPPGYEKRYSADSMVIPKNFLPEHPFDHGNFKGRDESLMAWPRTPAAVRDVLRVYYSVIDDLDRQVGRILQALDKSGQAENTIVIYASDHGMAVGSHGLRGKQNMYEHTINVPLIMRGPGILVNRRTDAQVYLRELYPTTCELIGVEIPDTVTARSFADVLKGEQSQHAVAIYGYFTDTQRMVRSDNWKLIRYPQVDRWQLFDLQSDPDEQKNLADNADHRARFEGLRKQLKSWRKRMKDPVTTE